MGRGLGSQMQRYEEEAVAVASPFIHLAIGGWGQFKAQTACGEISSTVFATINTKMVSCQKCISIRALDSSRAKQ